MNDESLIPVLTEIVDEASPARPPAVTAFELEALARELERVVVARLGPEVDRVVEERLASGLSLALGQALEAVRAELAGSITQIVRDAIAASVAHTLALPDQGTERRD